SLSGADAATLVLYRLSLHDALPISLWSSAGSKFEQARALRRLILPTLCRYADLYLAGHEHTLEVHTDDCSKATAQSDLEPLPQIVSGAAAKMRPINTAFMRNQME